MARNRYNANSNLQIGVGLRGPHVETILTQKPIVDWFEIISENYLTEGGRSLANLDRILEIYPIIQHGVGLYVGSAEGLDRDHLVRLKKLIRRTHTPWLSEHLAWGSANGKISHDLLPLPYTHEALAKTAENLRIVQDYLEVPFVLENVSSYVEFNDSKMTEWEFLSEVVEKADVGILLDVNNIYVSSQNHGFDPMVYLESIPLHRVAQIHIAGHSRYERFIIDTHDKPVADPVWQLYAHALKTLGPTPTLLEWDANIPSFEVVHAEAMKAKQFWNSSTVAYDHAS